jgi:septal ring factor EnvC (AmiA/AmiB activator)
MDEFDTEKDEIRLRGKKVEINSLDDLFPFLWNNPGICCHDNVKHASVSDFYSTGTWWEHRYDESIKEHEKEIDKLEKRLKKAADSRKPKIQERLAYEKESIKTLRRIIRRHNEEMEELKEAIRVDNKS